MDILFIIALIFFALSTLSFIELRKLSKHIQSNEINQSNQFNQSNLYNSPTSPNYNFIDKSELTSYELERLEREEEFDARINRLKDELAQQQFVIRKGVTAEELHPSVHNLPHDTVQTKHDIYSDVEVAD